MFLSADDVKGCMQKVHTLKYAQEVCYNGTLIIKAVSSGLEIGTCNWTINGPKRNIACLSSSIFNSSHAMNFDYHALRGNDLIIYSDLSSPVLEDVKDNSCYSAPTSQKSSTLRYFALHCLDGIWSEVLYIFFGSKSYCSFIRIYLFMVFSPIILLSNSKIVYMWQCW